MAWFSSVQSLSHAQLFGTPRTAACQASLSITNSQSSVKLMSIMSVMPSNHLILCCPLLLPFSSPGDLPNPGIEPRFPTLQADSLPAEPQGKPFECPGLERKKFKNSLGTPASPPPAPSLLFFLALGLFSFAKVFCLCLARVVHWEAGISDVAN